MMRYQLALLGLISFSGLLFWAIAADAQYGDVPIHVRITGAFFTGAFTVIACGNLFYQGFQIRSGSLNALIAKSLLYASAILFAYEVYIFTVNG